MANNVIKTNDFVISHVGTKTKKISQGKVIYLTNGVNLVIDVLNNKASYFNNIELTNVVFIKDGNIINHGEDNGIYYKTLNSSSVLPLFSVNFSGDYDEFIFTLKIDGKEKGRFNINLDSNQNNIIKI